LGLVKTITLSQKKILDIDRPEGKYKTKQHFVIPIEKENLSRGAINAYVYLYCVEKGYKLQFHNECILHLKRDFPFRYHLYDILFNYPVRKQFQTLARQNWQLLKSEVISRALALPDKMHANSC